MGLPSITINFKTQGTTAITRSQKGMVAVILRDTAETGGHRLANTTEIPSGLSKENQDYLARAFTGYVNPPQAVLVYVVNAAAQAGFAQAGETQVASEESGKITEGLSYFALQEFDYLVGPPDITEEETQEIASWIKSRRTEGFTSKAVLPHCAADNEGVVNFTTDEIQVNEKTYTAAQYCSRIAGLIAGTPMNISCTYAPLSEVTDIARLSRSEMDAAVERGEFILLHDGKKVKVGRAVNSLVTTTQEKGAEFQKIKTVEAADMICKDIQLTAQDSYIGKYSNSYDNKCLLITAIQGYFEQLEQEGILQIGTSETGIDLTAQELYLQSIGIDTSAMSEQEIKEADTRATVFLNATIRILDAIEDINLNITI